MLGQDPAGPLWGQALTLPVMDLRDILAGCPRGRTYIARAVEEALEGSGYSLASVEIFHYFNLHPSWCILAKYHV